MRRHRLQIESSSNIAHIRRFHRTRFEANALGTDTRERAGRELMSGLRRPENFTHRKAASINYETYTGRGGATKQK